MMHHGDTVVGPTPRSTGRPTVDTKRPASSVLHIAEMTKRTAAAIVADLGKLRGSKPRTVPAVADARQQPAAVKRTAPRTPAELNRLNRAFFDHGGRPLTAAQTAAALDSTPRPIRSTADMNRYYASFYARDSETEKHLYDGAEADPGYNPYTGRETSQDAGADDPHWHASIYGKEFAAEGVKSLADLNEHYRRYYSAAARAAADRRTVDAGPRGIRSTADMARYLRAYFARR